jgi:hypothetical protein
LFGDTARFMKAGHSGDDMQLRRGGNPTASILIGVAAVQLVAGLIGLFVYRSNPDINMPELKWFLYHFQAGTFTALDWVVTFSGVLYILLALLAYRVRLPAVLLGVAVYAGLLLAQGPSALKDALVIKIVVLLLLALGVAVSFGRTLPPALSAAGETR